eukprot:scaffold3759_cov425-Prasinococcus_capsulatus_cf.AAC.7
MPPVRPRAGALRQRVPAGRPGGRLCLWTGPGSLERRLLVRAPARLLSRPGASPYPDNEIR